MAKGATPAPAPGDGRPGKLPGRARQTLPDVKAIEDAVRSLPPSALAEFRRWFTEFDAAAWDRQIDSDAVCGKLDELLAEAEQDFKNPPSRAP
jgi:hypothetical protein